MNLEVNVNVLFYSRGKRQKDKEQDRKTKEQDRKKLTKRQLTFSAKETRWDTDVSNIKIES